MKPLRRVPAADVAALTKALGEALDGGDAVWPVPASASAEPRHVARTAAGDDTSEHFERQDSGVQGQPTVNERVALVVETSGSTDAPKRVMLSAEALIASADATADRLDGPGRWVLALPGHYIAGVQVLVRSILAGTTPVVLPDGPFTPE
ncbi:MAG: AMP-binding protein, partial [Agromyces sp.]